MSPPARRGRQRLCGSVPDPQSFRGARGAAAVRDGEELVEPAGHPTNPHAQTFLRTTLPPSPEFSPGWTGLKAMTTLYTDCSEALEE